MLRIDALSIPATMSEERDIGDVDKVVNFGCTFQDRFRPCDPHLVKDISHLRCMHFAVAHGEKGIPRAGVFRTTPQPAITGSTLFDEPKIAADK